MALIPYARENGPPALRDFGFDTLQREIDRVFDNFTRGVPVFATRPAFPKMDVTETDEAVEIVCELPGLEEKDVEVSLANGVLTISGEKHAEKEEKGKSYHLLERTHGAFSRTVAMPTNVDPASIKATMDKGVLKVHVGKPKSAAPHRIEVKPVA